MSARLLEHGRLKVAQVVGLDGVGLVIGEGAVELEVERDERERQTGEDRRRGESGHAVTGIDDHGQGPDTAQVDERVQVRDVVGEHVALGDASWRNSGRSVTPDASESLI